jgi:hypothetical protein
MTVSKQIASQVWVTHNGKTFAAQCKCCTCEVTVFTYHVANVTPQPKGGNADVSNLLPVCKNCHAGARTTGLAEYKSKHYPSKDLNALLVSIKDLPEESVREIAAYASSLLPKTTVSEIRHEKRRPKGVAPDQEPTGECKYTITRGKRSGLACGNVVYDGDFFCVACRGKKISLLQREKLELTPDKIPTGNCQHLIAKGRNAGKACGNAVYDSASLCVMCRVNLIPVEAVAQA